MPENASSSSSASPCPACGVSLSFWFKKRTGDGDFPVRRCGKCRSAFAMPRPGEDVIASLYLERESEVPESLDERYARVMDGGRRHSAMTADGRRIPARLRALGAGDRLLDIGAGDGFYARALIDAGFSVEAMEPGAEAREVFRRINGFTPLDGFLDEAFVASHAERYDAVLLSQVLEHLADPELMASRLGRLLRPGGIAVVGVPHFRSWLSRLRGRKDMFISPPRHLNYFTKAGLRVLMDRQGFICEHAETVTWLDPDRVAGRVPLRIMKRPALAGLRSFFALADRARGGNTLEAYFRKAVH
jgi:SAM-dependent methyltransferase